jgi:hypothetical protein
MLNGEKTMTFMVGEIAAHKVVDNQGYVRQVEIPCRVLAVNQYDLDVQYAAGNTATVGTALMRKAEDWQRESFAEMEHR